MDLDELERLLKAATAGPWWVYVHTGDGTTIEPGDDWTVYGKGKEDVVYEGAQSRHAAANAALIAALRNSAEELIRDARRWRYWREHHKGFRIGGASVGEGVDAECVDEVIDAISEQERK